MAELKRLSPAAIPRALEKAERYRLLHEPSEAQSICRDVLLIEPQNQQALVTLILALTDDFEREVPVEQARELLPRLEGEYERSYYRGIVCERYAKARIGRGGNGPSHIGRHWLAEAMNWFEHAESLRPAGNDDALLRWNACLRLLESLRPQAASANADWLE